MDATEEIKSRLAIEDVIGEYVELKRAGRNYKGLSPFGAEKTASFMVSPEKQIWHDFSSGKGGNMFSFVMEMEGLDFKGALELLARKAGVDLAQYRSPQYARNAKLKDRLYECNELAAKFYQLQFKHNQEALAYVFKERVLTKETVLAFRIGYAPDSGDALASFLIKKGFTAQEIKQAGLGNTYSGRMRDMFRGRVMIPLMDASGRVIGFTARLLRDNPNAPKYINTSQTLLYDKSRHVFGLHLAKEAIRKNDFAVVVEGNMDVIASYQAEVRNVVATAGTAMTKYHLKEISRFTHDVRLSFDQDGAGLNATERTVILANELDIKLGVITIPSGKDPDELIRTSKAAWQESITHSTYALDWLLERYRATTDLSNGAGKKAYAAKVMPVLNKITNAVEQEHYMRQVADILGVSVEALSSQRNSKTEVRKSLKRPKEVNQPTQAEIDTRKTENQFLGLLLMQPSLRIYSQVVTEEMLSSDGAAELMAAIKQNPKDKARDILAANQDVHKIVDYGKVVSLLYEELYSHLEFIELEYEAARLQVRVIEHYVKGQKRVITAQLQSETNVSSVTELLQKAKNLDQLLRQAKESVRGQ